MDSEYAENDGTYPDDSSVLVRYPRPEQTQAEHAEWPWLPGTILGQCHSYNGEREWHVRVDVDEYAELDEEGDGELWYPACFRGESELQPVTR